MRLPFFYGWVVVAIAFVTMAVGVNARTAFSLFFPPILSEFGWDRGLTAGAFSFGFVASMAFNPLIGKMMDRWGVRPVMLTGSLMTGAGLALAPLMQVPWHLYLTLGFLVAGGTTCMAYSGHSLFLPNWFVRRRGMAMGIAFSGVGVGSIVIMPWLQGLIARSGWRWACLAMAALLTVIALPLNLFQRTRPETMGLTPDGDEPADRWSSGRPRAAANVIDAAWVAIDWTLGRAIRTSRFWWVGFGFFTGLFAWYLVQVHQTKYLIEIGFDPSVAAWALGAVGLAGIVGQIGLGALSDRVGREWVWTLACLGFAACYLLLLALRASPTHGLLYLMVAFQGVLGYGLASVFGAIPAELFQGRNFGSIFGMLSACAIGGGALGPWLAGALHDHTGSYVLAFWLAIGCCLLSSGAMWLSAPRKVRAVAGRIVR